jgi:hypothetical protein
LQQGSQAVEITIKLGPKILIQILLLLTFVLQLAAGPWRPHLVFFTLRDDLGHDLCLRLFPLGLKLEPPQWEKAYHIAFIFLRFTKSTEMCTANGSTIDMTPIFVVVKALAFEIVPLEIRHIPPTVCESAQSKTIIHVQLVLVFQIEHALLAATTLPLSRISL